MSRIAPAWQLFLLGILAGFLIGMSVAATNTAVHAITNVSVSRIICGLLFPFGIAIVMMTGAELFTGNNMIVISVLDRKATVGGMLRNWMYVYLGNMIGGAAMGLLLWSCHLRNVIH
ncbi:MAG: formate/nitrite transporter family protein [Synergistaceae bacterium]|nr:formate/nitrite transporter family protein [Synergistaceae bacterium]